MIQEGVGTQCINYNEYAYQAGSIFLLLPLNCHSFETHKPSRFVFLKFTADFFKWNTKEAASQSEWFKEAAYILSNYNQLPGDIIQNELDRQHIHTLVELIQKDNGGLGIGSTAVIKNFMTSILEILLRNIKQGAIYELKAANFTLTEIADELNFTDVCHLSKTFKRYTGVNP